MLVRFICLLDLIACSIPPPQFACWALATQWYTVQTWSRILPRLTAPSGVFVELERHLPRLPRMCGHPWRTGQWKHFCQFCLIYDVIWDHWSSHLYIYYLYSWTHFKRYKLATLLQTILEQGAVVRIICQIDMRKICIISGLPKKNQAI